MGLDMYLYAKAYYSNAEWRDENERAAFTAIAAVADLDEYLDDQLPSIEVMAKVGYWRKANAVHKWFVDNVQGGEDECREHYVDRDKLVELKELCQQVLTEPSKANVLLPATSGFFFGSTEYDEWYTADVTATIEIIDRCLSMPANWEFYYQSSW